MSYESFDDIKFDLGPFLQGQMGSIFLQGPKSHLLLLLEVLNVKPTHSISCPMNLLMTNLTLDLSFKVKRSHLVLPTQDCTSGGCAFASGTDVGRLLSSFI